MKKILILAANPIDKVRLRLGEEVREIQNGLQRSQHRDQFVIKQQWATRTQDIRRAMLDVTPNIVHFCGHGEGEVGLVFEDKEGEAQFISTDALAGFFELFADTVDCVVLNACYSEVQAQAIAQHIDYVVGMSQSIGDQTAIEFAVAFYDALGAGRTVDFAYKLACNAIQMAGIDDHLIPVMIKREIHEGNDVQDDTPSAKPHEDQSQSIEKSGKPRKSLAFELNQKIVGFLTSIPNIHDSNNQRALLYSAGVDQALLNQINFAGPPGQFFQLLVPTLVSYGILEDGRDALEAVLEAAKGLVGQDKKDYCDTLIQELRSFRSPFSQQTVSPEPPLIAVTEKETTTSPGSHFDDTAQKQIGEKTSSFTWLHLTDFHCGMKNQHWLWPGVREIFFDDLKRLHEKCGPWDLVLFTGDLTQKGNAEEFQKVDKILEQLWKHFNKLGSSPKILAVPGNHDLVRPNSKDPSVRLLQQWEEHPDIQEEFWEEPNSPYRQVVTRAFENYTTWWEKQPLRVKDINTGILNTGILPGDFSVTIEKNGAKLGIVGFNTSFLQLTGDDYQGKLALHTMQFHGVSDSDGPAWANQHHACVLMTHHPPVWLNADSQQHLHGEIVAHSRFAVHLCGHMHETAYREIAEGGTEARRLWQGRSLFGLEYYGKESRMQRMHGYSVGRIELSGNTGSLTFWPREDRKQGSQRNIVPDYSVNLPVNEHTSPSECGLLQPYIIKETSLPSESSPEPPGDDTINLDNSHHASRKNKKLDVRILAVLHEHYQNTPGEPKISFKKLLDEMGEKDFKAVHEELFKLKEKGWINSEFLEDGQAGLVWITSTGMKIARQLT